MGGPVTNLTSRLVSARSLQVRTPIVQQKTGVNEVERHSAAGGIHVPQPTVNRFGNPNRVTEALKVALSKRVPPELASAHIDREGFALIPDVPLPFTPAEIKDLFRLLIRIDSSMSQLHLSSRGYRLLDIFRGDEKKRAFDYFRRLESYGALLLQRAGLGGYPDFMDIRYTNGSRPIYFPSSVATTWHRDGGYAAISVALIGPGTMVQFGEKVLQAPTGVPLIISASARAEEKGVPNILHQAPPFQKGEERFILLIRIF